MRRWWAPALVAVVVLVYALLGEQLRGCLGLPGDGAAPTKGAGLRMATWNLRNFPEPTQDHSRLRERLQGLGADLLAVQEIHDRVALQALLPGWDLHLSEQGGRGHQRLGIAFDPDGPGSSETADNDDGRSDEAGGRRWWS